VISEIGDPEEEKERRVLEIERKRLHAERDFFFVDQAFG